MKRLIKSTLLPDLKPLISWSVSMREDKLLEKILEDTKYSPQVCRLLYELAFSKPSESFFAFLADRPKILKSALEAEKPTCFSKIVGEAIQSKNTKLAEPFIQRLTKSQVYNFCTSAVKIGNLDFLKRMSKSAQSLTMLQKEALCLVASQAKASEKDYIEFQKQVFSALQPVQLTVSGASGLFQNYVNASKIPVSEMIELKQIFADSDVFTVRIHDRFTTLKEFRRIAELLKSFEITCLDFAELMLRSSSSLVDEQTSFRNFESSSVFREYSAFYDGLTESEKMSLGFSRLQQARFPFMNPGAYEFLKSKNLICVSELTLEQCQSLVYSLKYPQILDVLLLGGKLPDQFTATSFREATKTNSDLLKLQGLFRLANNHKLRLNDAAKIVTDTSLKDAIERGMITITDALQLAESRTQIPSKKRRL